MKIDFTVKFSLEVDESELLSKSPQEYVAETLEDDPYFLYDNSALVSHTVTKVTKDKAEESDDDLDDDGLSLLDEDDLDSDEY